MKYKVLKSNSDHHFQRTDYLYEKYCINKSISADDFVHHVKDIYYKYDAFLYSPNYVNTQKRKFINLKKTLPPDDYAIVDIGAGTGESYKIFKTINLNFKKYYFIEPFSKMIEQFDDKDNKKVVLINDYFESEVSIDMLKKEAQPKLYLMCAVLRTLNNINEFADILKENMQKGDRLFLPVEPNNNYFGKYFKYLKPFIFAKKLLIKLTNVFSLNKSKSETSKIEKDPLSNALQELKETKVVNDAFTRDMIYAIIYCNNYFCWKNIEVPEKYNEGFFCIEEFAKRAGCEVEKIDAENYLYGFSFGLSFLDLIIEKAISILFPNRGSTISVLIRKL
jgi:ubiquinone/menaquinone biosynthesis C-methylase UbiE